MYVVAARAKRRKLQWGNLHLSRKEQYTLGTRNFAPALRSRDGKRKRETYPRDYFTRTPRIKLSKSRFCRVVLHTRYETNALNRYVLVSLSTIHYFRQTNSDTFSEKTHSSVCIHRVCMELRGGKKERFTFAPLFFSLPFLF